MITRHNHEEQFLLYLDNELSQADRLSVEAFVKDNPDLLEELETFRQCRLMPEEGPSFGNPALLLKIATTGPFLLPARTWRMTRIAAAALLLLLASLIVFIATRPSATAPVTVAPHTVSSPSPYISSSPAQIATTTRSLKKEPPAVTPGTHGALYLATAQRERVNKEIAGNNRDIPGDKNKIPQDNKRSSEDNHAIPDEGLQDQVLASTRVSVPGQVTFIDPAITRAPEKIIVAQTLSPVEDPSEDLPAEKNKLRGVFRKISRVLEKTTAQNDNDRHAILIGNLQIAL